MALRRGVFRQLVAFFKKRLYVTFDKGKIEKTLFKGLSTENEDDVHLKTEILKALEAFRASKTVGYTSR